MKLRILLLLCSAAGLAVVPDLSAATRRDEETALREARRAAESARRAVAEQRAQLERERERLVGTGEDVKTERREHRIDVPAQTLRGRLTLTGLTGEITVDGTDEPVVVITGDVEVMLEPPEPPEPPEPFDSDGKVRERPSRAGLRSLLGTGGTDNSGLGLEIKTEGNNITIVALRPHEQGDYQLRVPRTMALALSGLIHGEVQVTGMQGEIEAVVPEGDVLLREVHGPVVVQSVNGDVRVHFSSLAASGPSSVNAVNGTVEVALPTAAAVTLDMQTINGDILSDLPIEVTSRKITPFHGPRSLKGTLNGGGVELRINCINDDILLRGASAATGATPAQP